MSFDIPKNLRLHGNRDNDEEANDDDEDSADEAVDDNAAVAWGVFCPDYGNLWGPHSLQPTPGHTGAFLSNSLKSSQTKERFWFQ